MTMPNVRTCDECGTKLPAFRPRNRKGERMVCDGCADGKPGSPGRPVGLHGAKKLGFIVAYADGSYEMATTQIEAAAALDDGAVAAFPMERFVISVEGRIEPRLGHDSGDGETIYHCPFCGGGQVVAGSDGTVECGFCNTHFTVQVQPERAQMPQTVNGQPVDMPGMPGSVDKVPEEALTEAPQDGQDPATAPAGGDAFIPPGAFAPPPGGPTNGQTPTATATRYFINAQGMALDEEAYMRHLAIRFASPKGKQGVLEQIIAGRANGHRPRVD